MSNKIVIVQPSIDGPVKTDEYQKHAEEFAKGLGYEIDEFDRDDIVKLLGNTDKGDTLFVEPFIIGMMSVAMSRTGSVCFGYGYKKSKYAVDLFTLAFRYGINIIVDPLNYEEEG